MRATTPTVLVTAVGGGGVGEQVLKALCMAGRYRIVGTDIQPRCPQFDLVDVAITLPPANAADYLEALKSVAIKLGVQAILPGSEMELLRISEERDVFEAEGILLLVNTRNVIDIGTDKIATAGFLASNGFRPPRSALVEQLGDLGQIDWFPVVLKPARGGGGSRDTFIAQSPRELELVCEYITATGIEMMVQEYVGTPDAEFTVGVLHGLDGSFINSIALRRVIAGPLHTRLRVTNRTGRMELGDTLVISSGVSHGYVGEFPEVTGPCERIASALGARGPLNIQCRLVDGDVRVFEINPRFSGTTSVRAMVGFNEPDILLRRHLLGEEIDTRFEYESALVLRSLTETVAPDRDATDWRLL